MTVKSLSNDYFEQLGKPKPGQPFGSLDNYRFKLIHRNLAPGSVLDVGAYLGDFLKIACADNREVFGTDVNEDRVKVANELVGAEIVNMDFRNGRLSTFNDSSIDNVVCSEVIEHVPDDVLAIRELCRVAKSRVIITVPFREDIKEVLCVHCNNYTPHSGHLHSYDYDTIRSKCPSNWQVVKESVFGKKFSTLISRKLPNSTLGALVVNIVDCIQPGSGRWLLVVLSPVVN